MRNLNPQPEESSDYALYPVSEIKQLYIIKAQYELLLKQLDTLHRENMYLKQELSRYQS